MARVLWNKSTGLFAVRCGEVGHLLTGISGLLQSRCSPEEFDEYLGYRREKTKGIYRLTAKNSDPALAEFFTGSDITQALLDFVKKSGIFHVSLNQEEQS